MQIVLPETETGATLRLRLESAMDDERFFDFCMHNRELRIERTAQGEIIVMPPAGFETGFRNSDITAQLTVWAKKDGRGVALDSNTEYILPNGAARSPDASWVLKSRLTTFTKQQKKRFLPLCPDFVIELISPSDRLNDVRAKMVEWIAQGAQLGWLIDADRRSVLVYRPDQEPQEVTNVDYVTAETPLTGFNPTSSPDLR